MPTSFQELLDYRQLTASFNAVPSVGNYPLTTDFFVNTRQYQPDEYELIYYPSVNTPAPLNTRGTPAHVLAPQGGTKRNMTLFHAFNEVPLPAFAFNALREPESQTLQRKGANEIARIQEEFDQRHRIMREAIISSIMSFGRVNMDDNGNILRPTVDSLSGALTNNASDVLGADFTVDNSHRGNLNDTTDGSIIDSMWSNSNARIFRHLEKIRDRAIKNNIQIPTEIYIHRINKHVLIDNAEFKAWAQASNIRPDVVLQGEGVNDVWGWNWHFIGNGYTDVNGTYVDLIPRTHAVICPKPGPWLRAAEGLELVPTSLEVQTDLNAAIGSLREVYGRFSYAKVRDNPAGLTMFMGDNWGLNFADPNAIWMPNVFETDSGSSASGTG